MKKKLTTIDDLAMMTGRGLRDIEDRLSSKMDKGFEKLASAITDLTKGIDQNFQHMTTQLDRLRDDVSDMPTMRQELHTLRGRVERLERRAASSK